MKRPATLAFLALASFAFAQSNDAQRLLEIEVLIDLDRGGKFRVVAEDRVPWRR